MIMGTRVGGIAAWVLRVLVYWIVATSAVHVFMQKQAFFEGWHHQEYAFESFLNGTAHRPFAYRVLTPWTVNLIEDALPEAIRNRYQPAARAVVERYSKRADGAFWTPRLERQFMIAFVLMVLHAFAALLALRALLSAAMPDERALQDLGPLLFGTVLPLSFMNGGFLYDFAEMFFGFVVLALAWRGRWLVMLPVLALAVLNKETSALLVPMVAIVLRGNGRGSPWMSATALAVMVAAVVVLVLRATHAELPGSTMYDHIRENATFWSDPSSWFATMNLFTPLLPVPRGLNLLMIVPLVAVLAVGWRERPRMARQLLIASAAINLPLFFLFCWRDETRNLSLMYPALCVNVCMAMAARYAAGKAPERVAAQGGTVSSSSWLRPSDADARAVTSMDRLA